jgi:hypothetical protein
MIRTLQRPLVLAALGALTAFPGAAGETRAAGKSERVQVAVSKPGTTRGLRLRFAALGRDFQLRLEPNPRLAAQAEGSRWQQYAGSIPGEPASWARLSVAGGSLRGVIFDGHELLQIEPGADGATEITRLADVALVRDISFIGDLVPAPVEKQVGGGAPAAPRLEGISIDRKLEVSVIGDASFRARYASDAEARDAMLTRLNIVDGIFSAQVGVGVAVTSVNVGGALGDALDASTDPPILLDSLGRLRQQTPALNDRGLTHLFTGRDLDADSVGIAYSAALCNQRYSASLAQAHNGAAIDGLISAHEIGHVFGAPHDGEGQCAATSSTQFIMAPMLNTQANTFSQCSLDQMAPRVASASCLRPLQPPDMALPSSLGDQAAAIGANFNWRIELQNRGERMASNARVTVELTPALSMVSATPTAGSCVVQASLATCDLASVNGGESVQIDFLMTSATAGTFAAHAQVVTPDDADRSNDTSDGRLVVQAGSTPPAPSPPAPEPAPDRSGGGALDVVLLGLLAALLGVASRRRRAVACFSRRASCARRAVR